MTDTMLEEMGALDILLNMFFVYNAIIHSSIVIINSGIIFKEISLEFFKLAYSRPGESFGLGFLMLWESTTKIFHIIDPLELIPRMFKFLIGKTIYYVLAYYLGGPFIWAMSWIY